MKKFLSLILLLMPVLAWAAPVVTISLNPASGTLPYTSTLTWNATGVASCSASGAWTGAKPTSGTQTVTITAANQTYKLDCAEAVQTILTNWTLPTKREDGSALILGGFNLMESIDGASWRNLVTKGATDTSHVWTGLTPGLHYFQIQSVDTAGVASRWLTKGDDGTVVSGTIPVPLVASSTAIGGGVSPPNPPSGFKVTISTLAYELRGYSGGTYRFVQVGTVPLGKACGPQLNGQYALFSGATITKPTTGGAIAAKCI